MMLPRTCLFSEVLRNEDATHLANGEPVSPCQQSLGILHSTWLPLERKSCPQEAHIVKGKKTNALKAPRTLETSLPKNPDTLMWTRNAMRDDVIRNPLSQRVWRWDEPGCWRRKMNEWVTLVRRSFMVGRLKWSKPLGTHCQQGCFSKYFTRNLVTLESLSLTKPLWQIYVYIYTYICHKGFVCIVYSVQLLLFFF